MPGSRQRPFRPAPVLLFSLSMLAGSCSKSAPPTPAPTTTPPESESCTFAVSASTTSFGAAGGSGSATVTTSSGCAWTASSPVSWVQVGADSHTGSGTLAFTVAPSSETAPRAAVLTIARLSVSISQEAAVAPPSPCVVAVSARPTDYELDGGNGVLTIAAAAGCRWTAKSDASWAVLDGALQGDGPASLTFSVRDNPEAPARKATFTVGDKTAAIAQPGQGDCSYTVSPVTTFIPRIPWSEQIAVSTARGCTWTVSSDASWVRAEQTSGRGPATVIYDADFNPQFGYAESRTGVLAFRWLAPTAGQNVRVRQSGACNVGIYAATGGLAPGSTFERDTSGGTLTAGAAGGQFHFWVQTDPYTGCATVLEGGDAWVELRFPKIGQVMGGDYDLTFTLPPNPASQARRTVFLMDRKPLTIVQQGR